MQALLEFSRRTGIWIISDEVYGRLYFDGDGRALDPADRRGRRPRAVGQQLLQGLGDDRLARRLADPSRPALPTRWRDDAIHQQRHAGPLQAGATAAITKGEPLVEEIRQRIKTGLDLAYDRLAQIPGIILPTKPRGGMYAFFAVEGESDCREACADILEKARVGLAPGYLFGSRPMPSCACACIARPASSKRRSAECSP